jgi:hypothetical protein
VKNLPLAVLLAALVTNQPRRNQLHVAQHVALVTNLPRRNQLHVAQHVALVTNLSKRSQLLAARHVVPVRNKPYGVFRISMAYHR